ncbi:hypothetical protein Godav_009698, partial [Gossypium davidsonii]|nr:hypothetical protein [Gossypium davidsonii]
MASSTPNISPSAQGLTQFQGFWIPSRIAPISSIISFQKYFQALDEDIIVASKPKAGTTWLKALVFTIVNRHSYTLSNTPLNFTNPHQLISHFEIKFYKENPNPDLSKIPSPRLFSTHLPYPMLADSIKLEDCFEMFCRGEESYGPFWDHALGFNNLKDLEINKTGKMPRSIIPSNKLFFRSGKVGDYVNHLSPTVVERLSNILKEKLSESSLTF